MTSVEHLFDTADRQRPQVAVPPPAHELVRVIIRPGSAVDDGRAARCPSWAVSWRLWQPVGTLRRSRCAISQTDDKGARPAAGSSAADVRAADVRAAEARAAEAEQRLQLLTSATQRISSVLDPDEAIEQLVRLAVPAFADWCLVAVVDEDPALVVRHRDAAMQQVTEQLREHILRTRLASPPVRDVLDEGRPLLVAAVAAADLEANVTDPVLRETYRVLGMRSVIIAPLWVRGRVIGNVSFVVGSATRRPYSEADEATAAELAQRTALTLDNARLIARQRSAAETLQRSLLPELPVIAGISLSARYLPASRHAQVGGDWYDVLPLPGGSIGVAVGDVMGHDLEAAAAMGQLRSVLRGYAWDGDAPATVLSRLDRLVNGLEMAQLATAVYGRLQLLPAGGAELEYANAGHLPPLLRLPAGETVLLDAARTPLIGLPDLFDREQACITVPPGALLVLYTDGLVEDRTLPSDEGITALQSIVESAPTSTTPDAMCERILSGMPTADRRADDIALLVLQLDAPLAESGRHGAL